MPKLSVIIPVYNEAGTLMEVLRKIKSVNLDKEIIVVDDASSDGTTKLLKEAEGKEIRVIYFRENRGKGAAFLKGLECAHGEFVIPQDGDLEYDPHDFVALVGYAQKNNLPVVYGSRFMKNRGASPLWHYLANKFLTGLTNILFGSSLTDMETCYKLIRSDVIKQLDLKARRFDIEPEITGRILKNGLHIAEIPISYAPRFYQQGKKIGWLDAIATILCLIKVRLKRDERSNNTIQ